ncbi:hypothetical protein [Falsiroseomonas sp. CW058]|uniref:hypothetical protein n=1 Tax=Falsiroseomonas sp. CW058 TaxID=3388664 RepID=UPI003D311E98
MPISREDRARYPADWAEISLRIRGGRAGWRCESVIDGRRCDAVDGGRHPITGSRVVLTVGHLNHTPEDNREDNLRAMCQRCHLAWDREHHLLRRRKKRGTPDLLETAPHGRNRT